MNNVVINILQGSAATQTVQGWLVTHPFANFLQYMFAKNYANSHYVTVISEFRKWAISGTL